MKKLSKRRMAQTNDEFMKETGMWHTLYTIGIMGIIVIVILLIYIL